MDFISKIKLLITILHNNKILFNCNSVTLNNSSSSHVVRGTDTSSWECRKLNSGKRTDPPRPGLITRNRIAWQG